MRLFPLLWKAFSLTGVNYANLIIPDKTLREAFIAQRNADHYGSIEPLIHAALLSAYTNEGARWVKEMNDYVLENIRLVRRFFQSISRRSGLLKAKGRLFMDRLARSWPDGRKPACFFGRTGIVPDGPGRRIWTWRGRVYPDEHGASAR